jgi:hypothetical protein
MSNFDTLPGESHAHVISSIINLLMNRSPTARNRPMVKIAVHCISTTCHISGLVAYGCIIQVARNGNLQIEMHFFASQQLPKR